MRALFPEFNKPTDEEFKKLWDEAIFVFDTNVLLGLYRYPQKTRNKLLGIFDKLKNRVWIPHQVGLEYYRKRSEVIYDQQKAYEDMLGYFEKAEKEVKTHFDKYLKHPYIDCKKILKKISDNHKAIRKDMSKLKDKHPDWSKEDGVEKKLNELFEGKVGVEYLEKKLLELYPVAQGRYDKEIPPGYKDKEKDKNDKTGLRKFGDFIIWQQIIDHAKSEKKPIIFITDEQKDDWWQKVHGNTVGPRYELIKEIKDQAGITFHMYQSDQFMERASEHLKIKVDKNLIEEIKKIKEETLRQENDNEDLTESSKNTSALADSLSLNSKFQDYELVGNAEQSEDTEKIIEDTSQGTSVEENQEDVNGDKI